MTDLSPPTPPPPGPPLPAWRRVDTYRPLWLAVVAAIWCAGALRAQDLAPVDYAATYAFTYVTDTAAATMSAPVEYLLLATAGEVRFVRANTHFNDSMHVVDVRINPEPAVFTSESLSQYANDFMTRAKAWRKPSSADGFRVQKLPEKQTANVLLPLYPPRYLPVGTGFDWRITGEQRQIGGYACVRATTRYGGRDYEAWFAPEVPIPDGPYVFGGLPGLIVALGDTRGWYRFELTHLATERAERFWRPDFRLPKAQPIDRPTFVAEMYKQKHNPSMMGVEMAAEDVVRMKAARVGRFYLFLEQND